jgi:histidyl-tRNA synthetase
MFNTYPIKKSSSVIYVLKKNQDFDIEITGDITEIFDVFGITDTKTEPKVLIDIILENRKSIRSIVNYLKNNISDIDIPRLLRYIQYRQTNPFSSNNEIGLKLMYGD